MSRCPKPDLFATSKYPEPCIARAAPSDANPVATKTLFVLKPNFWKLAIKDHSIDSTRSSWWPPGSELSSSTRRQAGPRIGICVESPQPLFNLEPNISRRWQSFHRDEIESATTKDPQYLPIAILFYHQCPSSLSAQTARLVTTSLLPSPHSHKYSTGIVGSALPLRVAGLDPQCIFSNRTLRSIKVTIHIKRLGHPFRSTLWVGSSAYNPNPVTPTTWDVT